MTSCNVHGRKKDIIILVSRCNVCDTKAVIPILMWRQKLNHASHYMMRVMFVFLFAFNFQKFYEINQFIYGKGKYSETLKLQAICSAFTG